MQEVVVPRRAHYGNEELPHEDGGRGELHWLQEDKLLHKLYDLRLDRDCLLDVTVRLPMKLDGSG